jgi:hypothetical protein
MAILTLDQLKAHLKLSGTEDDDDLELKLAQAEAIVLGYVNQRVSDADDWSDTVTAWTSSTAPPEVKAAILMQAGELYRYRGDDEAADTHQKREHGMLSPYVMALLYRYRDPALS